MRGAQGRIQLGALLTYLQICTRPLLTMRATIPAMGKRMNFTASTREKGLLQLSAQINVRASPPSNLNLLTQVQTSLWWLLLIIMKLSEISSKVLLCQEHDAEECAKSALRAG